ncbi:MAG: universal stress protein [Lactobacillales bacterium]|jgi:nucleotide-binding universal stress UspA family protein|nr:universal stress protein [Lactobacillales bacterium]
MFQQYKHILIAIDGSKESDTAFKKAVNVAKRNEATLTITHIIDTRAFQTVSSFNDGILVEQATQTAKDTLEKYESKAKKEGCSNTKTIIEYGSPKFIIGKQLPKEENIDLILLGATGLNSIERFFIGSVSEYVIRHAPCDVLIIRTDMDNNSKILELE